MRIRLCDAQTSIRIGLFDANTAVRCADINGYRNVRDSDVKAAVQCDARRLSDANTAVRADVQTSMDIGLFDAKTVMRRRLCSAIQDG